MGIIFRNGIPFGAAEDDVTTVYAYEDLFDLTDKKENHLYIVEETNIPYRYDAETEQFYPLGADVPPIKASYAQLLTGTGSVKPKEWAKGNDCNLYSMPFWKDNNITPVTGGVTPSPTYFGIGMIEGPPFETAFGTVKPASTQGFNYPITYLKNGFSSRDTALAKIQGASNVIIGEKEKDYSNNTDNPFWGRVLSGPEVTLAGTAKVEMLGMEDNDGGKAYGTPTVSMRGDALIDMRSCPIKKYANFIDWEGRQTVRYPMNPWGFSSYYDWNQHKYVYIESGAPLFQMHDATTFSMVEQAFFQMKNAAYACIQGDSYIKISGGQYTDRHDDTPQGGGKAYVFVEPYSAIKVRGDSDNDGVVSVEPGQIMIGSGFGRATMGGDNQYPYVRAEPTRIGDLTDSADGASGFIGTDTTTYSCNKISSAADYSWLQASMHNTISGPTFMLQGNIDVQADGEYPVGIYLGKSGGSLLMDLGGTANSMIKIAPSGTFTITANPSGNNTFSYNPDGGNHIFHFAQSGTTSFNWDTQNCFGLNMIAANTDLEAKWYNLRGIFDGFDHFIQMDGNTHLESWSSTVILRTSDPYQNINGSERNPFYPKFTAPEGKSQTGSIGVDKDLSNYTIQEIEEEFSSRLKDATYVSGNSFIKYIWKRFTNTSKTKLPSTYTETLSNINNILRIIDSIFVESKDYPASMSLSTFLSNSYVKTTFQNIYGTSDIVTNSNTTLTYTGRDSWGYRGYRLENFALRYSNGIATQTVNSTTDYVLNYPNLSAGEVTPEIGAILSTHGAVPRHNSNYPDGVLDFSQTTTGEYTAKENFHYTVTTTSVYDGSDSHLGKNWRYAIQTADRMTGPNWDKSPIIQMYGQTNFMMREKWSNCISISNHEFTPTITYDLSNQRQAVLDFINGPDYADFESYIEETFDSNSSYEFLDIQKLIYNENTEKWYVQYYYYQKINKPYLDSFPTCPVLELTDDSELRLHNGAKITMDVEYGETIVKFENRLTEEEPVSFTLAELKALKALLTQIPIQVVQSASEATEQGIMYFVDGGGN